MNHTSRVRVRIFNIVCIICVVVCVCISVCLCFACEGLSCWCPLPVLEAASLQTAVNCSVCICVFACSERVRMCVSLDSYYSLCYLSLLCVMEVVVLPSSGNIPQLRVVSAGQD